MKERPIGVMIIAVLLLFNGALTLWGAWSFQASATVYALGIIAILLAIGMWRLMSWAWYATLLLQIITLGYALYDWFLANGPIDVFGIAIALIVIVYLLSSGVQEAFGRRKPAAVSGE
jgi:uncharacterized membrane protein (DUF2068 family)